MSDLKRAHRDRLAHLAEKIAAGKRVSFSRQDDYDCGWCIQRRYMAFVSGERPEAIFTAHSEAEYKRLYAAAQDEFSRLARERVEAA